MYQIYYEANFLFDCIELSNVNIKKLSLNHILKNVKYTF